MQSYRSQFFMCMISLHSYIKDRTANRLDSSANMLAYLCLRDLYDTYVGHNLNKGGFCQAKYSSLHAGNCACSAVFFSKINFLKKILHEYEYSVK